MTDGPPYECDACGGESEYLIAIMIVYPIVMTVCSKCHDLLPDEEMILPGLKCL